MFLFEFLFLVYGLGVYTLKVIRWQKQNADSFGYWTKNKWFDLMLQYMAIKFGDEDNIINDNVYFRTNITITKDTTTSTI